ncbi:MAG: alanine--tRNA ligase-related protein [Bacteriovorax sp.]|nr:alanine--tRNA ligase-related protein [Bacteriovorax sp.]
MTREEEIKFRDERTKEIEDLLRKLSESQAYYAADAMLEEKKKRDEHNLMISGEFIFKLSDTHGFPIEIATQEILEKGLFINWFEFIKSAEKAGWKKRKIIEKIKSAMQDLVGFDEYKNGLLTRLDLYDGKLS